MPRLTKRRKEAEAQLEKGKLYPLEEATRLLKDLTQVKFDATVDLAVRLGVDSRKADQMVRGLVTLPHGTGKELRVLALVTADKASEAQAAGADFVGLDDCIAKIKEGWVAFDVVVATPSVMGKVGPLGRILGPRGLMPNPKTGTVTPNVGKAIGAVKSGQIDFKVGRYGIVHASIGKVSFDADKIRDNAAELIHALVKMKPAAVKGTYMRRIYLSSTMSPSIAVDPKSV